MERDKASKDKRDFLKFLAGVGLGAVAAEVYERVYGIPMLEKSFRAEINYWMNKYNKADEEIKKLESENKSLKEGQEKVNELTRTLNYEDELEKESNSAIAFYKQQMNEAISKLKQIIEKYRILLGDERVSFESLTLKVLEDLKITQEKLLKVLPYFPLIKNLSFSPSKVVNDKIYDLNVSLEVISPLNTLEEVEVRVIPVEYRYFIARYGMREEDYDKVFPKEEVRSIKIAPRQLEREMFGIDFNDLKGGKEYIVEARVKDVGGNERKAEIKTPYIRQFENSVKTDNYLIGVTYYVSLPDWNEWFKPSGPLHKPLLGYYSLSDKIVQSKHIDWLTGYGVDCIFISLGSSNDINNLQGFLENPTSRDLHFAIMYESTHRLVTDEKGYVNLDNPTNQKILLDDIKFIAKNYLKRPNYLRIGTRPVIYIYESKAWYGGINDIINKIRKSLSEEFSIEVHLVADYAHPLANPEDPYWQPKLPAFDGFTTWAGGYLASGEYGGSYEKYLEEGYSLWYNFCKRVGKGLITSAIPGFDNTRAKYATPFEPLERSPEKFKERLKIALHYSYLRNSPPFIRIDTFNDFGENHHIEPTQDEFFTYLETILNTLKE
jgi:hypothetical protein